MIRTLHTFTTKLDSQGFDIVDTLEGYRVDYCGAETGDQWIAVLVADTYEEASDAIKSISESESLQYHIAIRDASGEVSTGDYRSDTEPVVGETVTVNLHDHNGHLIKVIGAVVEILETKEY